MADTVKTTKEIKLETGYTDGDTRTITMPDPIATSLLSSAVSELDEFIYNGGGSTTILIGDLAGAPFNTINVAKVVTTNETTLDLNDVEG